VSILIQRKRVVMIMKVSSVYTAKENSPIMYLCKESDGYGALWVRISAMNDVRGAEKDECMCSDSLY
jgi:hypothetical protein